MSRKIKDIKDKDTGELIYPKSHAKATYMSDGRTVEDAINQTGTGDSSSGGSGAYAEVSHGTGDTTFALTPNTFHVWDEVASLDLSFADETAGVANEYLFQFTSGATATTLTLPDGLKWTNIPTISENMIYQVSILKGIASMLGVIYKIITKFYLNTGSDTIEYTIEEGMTWGQFVDSNYNNGDFAKLGDYFVTHTEGIVTDSGLNVKQSDIIVPTRTYLIMD